MVSANTIYLWLSYQRYAILIFIVSASLSAAMFLTDVVPWFVTLPVVLISLYLFSVSVQVGSTIRKKMVLTRRTIQQIERRSFNPEGLMKYCTDPCWRVVVNHNLSLAGVPSIQRRELIREWTALANERQQQLVFVSQDGSVVHTYQNERLTTTVMNDDESSADCTR